jgi:hypothetical protein
VVSKGRERRLLAPECGERFARWDLARCPACSGESSHAGDLGTLVTGWPRKPAFPRARRHGGRGPDVSPGPVVGARGRGSLRARRSRGDRRHVCPYRLRPPPAPGRLRPAPPESAGHGGQETGERRPALRAGARAASALRFPEHRGHEGAVPEDPFVCHPPLPPPALRRKPPPMRSGRRPCASPPPRRPDLPPRRVKPPPAQGDRGRLASPPARRVRGYQSKLPNYVPYGPVPYVQ